MTHTASSKVDPSAIVSGFAYILQGLGIDLNDPHFADTPRRAAKAWIEELCAGLHKPIPAIRWFEEEDTGPPQMIVLRDIPVKSLCAHHLLPFIGTATIAYIPPRNRIIGLSKLSRIVDHFSRRPQVQERLTNAIADFLVVVLQKSDDHWTTCDHGCIPGSYSIACPVHSHRDRYPQTDPSGGGVGVFIKARHMCMELRGVNHRGEMITSALRGDFLNDAAVRQEFLALAREG